MMMAATGQAPSRSNCMPACVLVVGIVHWVGGFLSTLSPFLEQHGNTDEYLNCMFRSISRDEREYVKNLCAIRSGHDASATWRPITWTGKLLVKSIFENGDDPSESYPFLEASRGWDRLWRPRQY